MGLRDLDKDQKLRLALGGVCLLGFFFFYSSSLISDLSLSKRSGRVLSSEKLGSKLAKNDKPTNIGRDSIKDGLGLIGGNSVNELSEEKLAVLSKDEVEPPLVDTIKELDKSEKEFLEEYSNIKVPSRFQEQVNQIETRINELKDDALLEENPVDQILIPYADEDSEEEKQETGAKQELDKEKTEIEVVDRTTRTEEKKPFEDLVEAREGTKPSEEKLNHKKIVLELLERLKSTDSRARERAGIALRGFVGEGDENLLGEVLKSGVGDSEVKQFIIEALARTQGVAAVDSLIFEYDHSNESGRIAIARALGNFSTRRSELFIYKIIKGEVPFSNNILRAAYSSLGKINTASSRQVLNSLAKNPNVRVNSGNKHAIDRALLHSENKLDLEAVDKGIPGGSKLLLRYKGTQYHFFHPAFRDQGAVKPWLLICVHSSEMKTKNLFDHCLNLAKSKNIAVLVPVFDYYNFPDYGNLDYRSSSIRSDQRLWQIVRHVSEVSGLQTREMYLYGVEQGADFVTKLAMIYPGKFARTVADNPRYPRLDKTKLMPFGLGESSFLPNLTYDLAGFIKSDYLAFTPPRKTRRGAPSFFQTLNREALRSGYSNRVGFVESGGPSKDNSPVSRKAKNFMFANQK